MKNYSIFFNFSKLSEIQSLQYLINIKDGNIDSLKLNNETLSTDLADIRKKLYFSSLELKEKDEKLKQLNFVVNELVSIQKTFPEII